MGEMCAPLPSRSPLPVAKKQNNPAAPSASPGAKEQNPPDLGDQEQNIPSPAVTPVANERDPPSTVQAIKIDRRNQKQQLQKIEFLQMALKSALSSRSILCDKETAYKRMNQDGVALIANGIRLNEDIHATVSFLCKGTYQKSGWHSIFQTVDEKGTPDIGLGRRQQLVFDEDWTLAVDSPRKLWKRAIDKKLQQLLNVILTKDIRKQYKDPYHTLIRSKRPCRNQVWHYDQFFPRSTKCAACGDILPFVVILALEEQMFTFLDVEVKKEPTRVCMQKGDVLLVRGDCLHRGTDYDYSPTKQTYHVRGHAYIDPKRFKREENTTYPSEKYSKFLP
jgi:hypothetical protein